MGLGDMSRAGFEHIEKYLLAALTTHQTVLVDPQANQTEIRHVRLLCFTSTFVFFRKNLFQRLSELNSLSH